MSRPVRVVVWGEPEQEALVRQAAARGRWTIVAAGSSDAAAQGLDRALAVGACGSLRDAAQRDDVDLLWIASGQNVHAEDRRLIRRRGIRAISSEPLPATSAEIMADPSEARTATFVPLMRQSPGWRAATEALGALAGPAAAVFAFSGAAGEGSITARLHDALDAALSLFGEAQAVDAAGGRGHLTANLRFAGGRSASIYVSDCAGCWRRSAEIVSASGSLHIEDGAFTWHAGDGHLLDRKRPTRTAEPTPGALIAAAAGASAPPDQHLDPAVLLSTLEAALLSCRTGQGEDPRRLLEMGRRP